MVQILKRKNVKAPRAIAKRLKQRMPKSFARNDSGAIIIMFALMLPVIVGFVGLGLEVAMWYSVKRNLQSAADAAALAAAYEIAAGNTASINSSALTDATRNGYDSVAGSITINNPPVTGAYTVNLSAVEVVLNESRTMLFAGIINNSDVSISARAVALSGGDTDACILSLNPSAQKALEFSGNSAISATGCIVASNSSHASAIEITGNANVTADSISTVGNYSTQGSGTLNVTSTPMTNASPITDPYSALNVPTYSGCDQSEYKVTPSATQTITPSSTTTPYVFCNGIDVKGTLTLSPGIYVIDGGTFNLNASAVLTGSGVTIILTSSTGSGYAKFTMNGGATIDLSAAPTGDYAGILMYGDRAGPNQINTMNGNAAAKFNGALYFPSSTVEFAGNSSAGGTACTQIIADTAKITGATGITSVGCVAAGATLATVSATQLVE